MNKLFFILGIIIILIICYICSTYKQKVKILNKNELLVLLLNENTYYNTFNSLDLQVRNVSSIEEYIEKIKISPININATDKQTIYNATENIDNKMNNYNTVGLTGKKFNSIKWQIGIINGTEYEGGFPHTREDVIIIPKNLINSSNLMSILIHEKIHIYQKKYPEEIKLYLNYYNFKHVDFRENYQNSRANPDINNLIYMDENDNIMCCLYNDNPKNIMDVTFYPINNDKYEHPLEYMAYTLQDEIMNK
jgi:hypothetical protein